MEATAALNLSELTAVIESLGQTSPSIRKTMVAKAMDLVMQDESGLLTGLLD